MKRKDITPFLKSLRLPWRRKDSKLLKLKSLDWDHSKYRCMACCFSANSSPRCSLMFTQWLTTLWSSESRWSTRTSEVKLSKSIRNKSTIWIRHIHQWEIGHSGIIIKALKGRIDRVLILARKSSWNLLCKHLILKNSLNPRRVKEKSSKIEHSSQVTHQKCQTNLITLDYQCNMLNPNKLHLRI